MHYLVIATQYTCGKDTRTTFVSFQMGYGTNESYKSGLLQLAFGKENKGIRRKKEHYVLLFSLLACLSSLFVICLVACHRLLFLKTIVYGLLSRK